MKNVVKGILTVVMILALCACTTSKKEESDPNIPSDISSEVNQALKDLCKEGTGAWTKRDDTSLSDNDLETFDLAMQELDGAEYTPLALLATQVVAGQNYCFLTETTLVTNPPVTCYSLVYIYQDLEGNASINEIVDLNNEG